MPVSIVAGRNSVTYAGSVPSPVANSTQPSANSSPPGTADDALAEAVDHPPRQRARRRAAISGPGVTAKPASRIE